MKEHKNPIQRAFRYFVQCAKYYFIGAFSDIGKKADLLLVSSTPPILGATIALIKKTRNIPFLYDLQDIFPDSLVGTGLAKKGGLLWKIGRVIEDFTYKHADKIIVISEDFKKNIMAKGVPEDKIVVVYNWVDQNAVVDVPREKNKLFDKYHLDRGKFYIEYSGNIGLTQNMDMLLDAFNPEACEKMMCRDQISVGYDGRIYDCDFNQVMEMPCRNEGRDMTIYDLAGGKINSLQRKIRFGAHCYGCTAGAGSSCGGTLVQG